jgi:hypothetical protein
MTAPGLSGAVSSAFPSSRSEVVLNGRSMIPAEQVEQSLHLLTHEAISAFKENTSGIYRIETVVMGRFRS